MFICGLFNGAVGNKRVDKGGQCIREYFWGCGSKLMEIYRQFLAEGFANANRFAEIFASPASE